MLASKLRVILCFVTSVNTSVIASHSRIFIFRAEFYLNKYSHLGICF